MITCRTCIMDETCAPFTYFAEEGDCNYCRSAIARGSVLPREAELKSKIAEIRKNSRNGFDCVIGVSGGLDSSYLLARAVELGLKPLAVHMDNNWNSSMASRNIRRLVSRLEVPLVTVVTDWQTQKNIQLAFLAADVVDVELIYDNALHSVCYSVARRFGIKTILGGSNNATEGVEVPTSWGWKKFDGKNIRSIASSYGVSTKNFPIFTSLEWLYSTLVLKINWVSLLDSMPEYGRETALNLLVSKYGYTPYGSKHFENVFTRFYQGLILPRKFGIDKRKPHLSSEVVAGKMSRNEALEQIKKPVYTSEALLELDYRYVTEKLGLSEDEMENYLVRPPKPHSKFAQDQTLMRVIPLLLRVRRILIETFQK